MKLDLSQNAETVTVAIHGELDRETLTDNFWVGLSSKEQAQIQQAKAVEIDLADVKRADTSGLAWLINALRDIPLAKEQVKIKHIPDKLLQLAKLSNADILISPKL